MNQIQLGIKAPPVRNQKYACVSVQACCLTTQTFNEAHYVYGKTACRT